jgi:hypothetical protein
VLRGHQRGAYRECCPDTLTRLDPATGVIENFEEVAVGAMAATLGPDAIWGLSSDSSVTRVDLR